jgi:hypothetical protein
VPEQLIWFDRLGEMIRAGGQGINAIKRTPGPQCPDSTRDLVAIYSRHPDVQNSWARESATTPIATMALRANVPSTMPCQYCDLDRPFVKSHAIPEAFFRVLRDGERAPILVSDAAGTYPSRAPIGVYDRETLCDPCERRFGELDAYGAEVLLNRLDEYFELRMLGGEPWCYIGEDVDQDRLKMFFLAVLWRAAISRQPFYHRVRLGPYEKKLRSVIATGLCPPPDEFSVLMSRWILPKDGEHLPEGLMSPFLERWDGVNGVRLYFGKVVAYIKVDARPFTETLRKAALGMHSCALQLPREYKASKDFAGMLSIANAARARSR